MPLVIVSQTGPVPPEPPAPPPPPRPPLRVQTPYISWTPPGGPELILLTGEDVVALAGITGLGMPPEEQFETELATVDGFIRNHRRAGGGEVMIPLKVARDSVDTFTTFTHKRRDLVRSFDPRRGPGVLLWALPDGERRQLTALYSSGLESPIHGEQGAVLFAHHQVILRAEDPYWYGDERVIAFSPPENYEFFAPPGDPANVVYISSSTTTGDRDVTIDGEVDTWPVAVIGGACSTATLRNRDTGKALTLTPGLTAASHRLTIRMDPRTAPLQKFTRESGNSVWASVAGQFPVMWSLLPGLNRVTVTLTGTVPGQSFCEFRYRPRYLTA